MRPATGIRVRDAFLVARKDLGNEPLFFACLVFSIAAIIVPLMFLLSVKIGFIDRLKEDFIKDPRFREIRPDEASVKSTADLEFIRGLGGVVFLQPSVTFIPRGVDVMVELGDRRRSAEARLIPTGPGDPSAGKLEAGTMPEGDAVVISADLAETYELAPGAEITLLISRVANDKAERVQLPVAVSGVMSGEAAQTTSIWAPSHLDVDVERYRAGLGVAARGWRAVQSRPKQSFDRLLFRVPEALGEAAETSLRIRFGANRIDRLSPEEAAAEICGNCAGVTVPEGVYYLQRPASGRYSWKDVEEARGAVSDNLGEAWGLSEPVTLTLDGNALSATGVPHDLLQDGIDLSEGVIFAANDRVALSPETAARIGVTDRERRKIVATIPREVAAPVTIELPVTVRLNAAVADGQMLVSAALAGMLNRAREVDLSFDPENLSFNELVVGFRGFRAIAESFEVVPVLVESIEARGIPVRAMTSEIERLQRLERSLNLLVLIVGIVAAVGASAILASSYFANVQRKITQYACLRLIGFDKRILSLIPLFQAILTGIYGFLVSVVVLLTISYVSNSFVATSIGFDAQLSKFSFVHYVAFLVMVLLCSTLSALFAVRLATSTDPSGALK